ncbi:MAG: CoA-binding protein [Synergistota bacterium]|nr:CoA-binding protein [Synergistota bacterium]
MTTNDLVDRVLCNRGRVAVIGASDKVNRPVYDVMSYLKSVDIQLYPINPRLKGREILGQKCVSSLAEIDDPVDIVSLFISARFQEGLRDELNALPYKPAVWFQPGTKNPSLEASLREDGFEVVGDNCMKVAHLRRCTAQR